VSKLFWAPYNVGDLVRIEEEPEVFLVLEVAYGSNQIRVWRDGRKQWLPCHLLRMISEA